MQTKVSKALLALALSCLMLLCACGEAAAPASTPDAEAETTPAPQMEATPAPEAETPAPAPEPSSEPEPYPGYNMEQKVAAQLADANAKYPPAVKTLDNGVQVQRTPTDPTLHNTFTLKADSRGCAACHDDLNEALQKLPQGHLNIEFYGDVQLTVQHCIGCHTYSPDYVTEFNSSAPPCTACTAARLSPTWAAPACPATTPTITPARSSCGTR